MIVVVIALAWLLIAIASALVIGSGIRIADRRAPFTDHLTVLPADLTVADILRGHAVEPTVRN